MSNDVRSWQTKKTRSIERQYAKNGGLGAYAVALYDEGNNYDDIAEIVRKDTGYSISHATVRRYADIYRAQLISEDKA